ncbi:MAG TPA: hypothetical protein VN688_05955 [Gemmataceae bacterium]|nr:hypothetical protein [Gemmataceae bacterium]
MPATIFTIRAGPWLCVLVLLAAGCSPKSGRVALKGTITYQGAAIKEGSIQFEPTDAAQSYSAGAIVKDGDYSIPADKGLLPGKYSVKISAPEARGADSAPDNSPGAFNLAKERLPAKYNIQTTLTAEITAANPNQVDFKLD